MTAWRRRTNGQLRDVVYDDVSPIHGRGLYATRRIASGEYIGTFEGPEAKRNGSHVLWTYDSAGRTIGRRGKNLLRFINHARRCNAEFRGFDLYARRTIAAGKEITIDYGW